MKKGWTEVTLGESCRFEKGTSPTLKTESGPYPFVVTASYRRLSIDYQFNQPAVCIPLISSTGHGNAALHRIHYQDGKFALANLLVAAIPFEAAQLNAKFLWRYLSAVKDRKLVPLMRGTANVSLKEQDLLNITIPLPPMPEQQRIVAHLEAIEERLTRLRQIREDAHKEYLAFVISLAHRWELSREEKRARGWRECLLSEVLRLYTDTIDVEPTESYSNLGIYSFARGTFTKPPIEGANSSATKLFRVRNGQFIYSRLFAFEGAYAIVDVSQDGYFVSNEFPAFELDTNRILPEFLFAYFKSPAVWTQLSDQATGLGDRRRRIHPEVILSHQIQLPPIAYQEKVRDALNKLGAIRSHSKAREFDALIPSILDRIFNGI